MEIREIDGNLFRRMLIGGAQGIRTHINTINELNVFPVPDGDTGTNMSKTIESGIAKIPTEETLHLGSVADHFSQGSLFGARGNSGVILSQFFAGMCSTLSNKTSATVKEFSEAYIQGVKRSYSAVANPVEGTILTVFRESAEYAANNITEESSIEDFLKLTIDEAERSLAKTKTILPILAEANVVDSGGAGYLCIAQGMYRSLHDDDYISDDIVAPQTTADVNYDLFTADSVLEYGYCTECLVRLQNAKTDIGAFNCEEVVKELERLNCDSIVALKDGDVLKLHAHTVTPSDILLLCQKYGEFLNVKIENMSLQHSDKVAKSDFSEANKMSFETAPEKVHKAYGVVTVTTGDGMTALFQSLGADVVINGGQTGNPSAEQFLNAFEQLDVDNILVFPNNSNIFLTAMQAAELWKKGNVSVIPTKTIPQGYSALSVFNASVLNLEEQLADLNAAKDAVVSGEVTMAIRNSVIGGINVTEGEYIGILDGEIVSSNKTSADAICKLIEHIDDIDERELITLFVGADVSDEERTEITEIIENTFEDLALDVYIGGQEIYSYLIAVE